jgi:hypothetical protein
MAEYKILEESAPDPEGVTRSTIRVEFEDQKFDQPIVTTSDGVALEAQLQNYADEYERQWLDLVSKALLGIGGAAGAVLLSMFFHSPALFEKGMSMLLLAMMWVIPGSGH